MKIVSYGKLESPDDLEDALLANQFQPLPITIPHALLAGQLLPHHDGPFDRLLIAQSRIEGAYTCYTRPEKLLYDVRTIIA